MAAEQNAGHQKDTVMTDTCPKCGRQFWRMSAHIEESAGAAAAAACMDGVWDIVQDILHEASGAVTPEGRGLSPEVGGQGSGAVTPGPNYQTTRSVLGHITRKDARRMWGDDPQKWPSWDCVDCGQRMDGWTLECGRCGSKRHGGAS